MKFIQESPRQQTSLFPISLDDTISEDNLVRIINLFVPSLNLVDYGFKVVFDENGRPAYHPSDLLKPYIYGYMNRVRSSRGLEKECGRNTEVMWLSNSLKPDHNTISNFRRDNGKAINNVIRATVSLAKHFELIGGEPIAGDSTSYQTCFCLYAHVIVKLAVAKTENKLSSPIVNYTPIGRLFHKYRTMKNCDIISLLII